jgi:hypothetical protein
MQAIWREVLSREVPLEAVESLEQKQIFLTYASEEQKKSSPKFQRRFWDLVLCLDKLGVELLALDEPVPSAAEVVKEWNRRSEILYVTGRTENTRKLTISELESFDFPIVTTRLFMLRIEDYSGILEENPKGPTLAEAKAQLFSSVAVSRRVIRVVDDFPDCFPVYKQLEVPDRIGYHVKRFPLAKYAEKGATRVVESWSDLLDSKVNTETQIMKDH